MTQASSTPRRRSRKVPFVGFVTYYLVLLLVATAAVAYVPAARDFFLAPLSLADVPSDGGFLSGAAAQRSVPAAGAASVILARSLTTVFIALGAVLLAVPVAWVYMFTRRLRYDRSLVHAIIILPMVVAMVVMVIKNSLALAFALAGIVAAVRWRTTVKDPKDAVYIFLMMGLGLAAGVQALDIAFVASLAFNSLILLLWKFNVGALKSIGAPAELMFIGDRKLLTAQDKDARDRLRDLAGDASVGLATDGILSVHTYDPAMARGVVEVTLQNAIAKDWRFMEPIEHPAGLTTLRILLAIRKKVSPLDMLDELEDHWPDPIDAAEYVPFRTTKKATE